MPDIRDDMQGTHGKIGQGFPGKATSQLAGNVDDGDTEVLCSPMRFLS